MNICYATNYLPLYHRTWGGAEMACYRLAKLLINQGQQVSILTTKRDKEVNGDFLFYEAPILEDYLGKIGRALKTFIPFDPISGFSSFNILNRTKPDILHLHNFNILSFSLIHSAQILGIPILISIYDYWYFCPKRTLLDNKGRFCRRRDESLCLNCFPGFLQKVSVITRRRFFDYFLNKVDTFIVLSQSSANILQDYGIKREKIRAVPLPLLNDVTDIHSDMEENSILFVGWIHPHKGLHILLKAMPEILKEIPQTKLYVLETGVEKSYKKYILESIKELGLDGHIFMFGKQSLKKVKEFMQKVSVVAIPEQWENMLPLVLAEAMSLAKPIIASRIGGIPEFIEDGKSGSLVNPKKSSEFSEKIIWLLKNKGSATEMGKEARYSAIRIFNEGTIVQKLLDIYQSIKK